MIRKTIWGALVALLIAFFATVPLACRDTTGANPSSLNQFCGNHSASAREPISLDHVVEQQLILDYISYLHELLYYQSEPWKHGDVSVQQYFGTFSGCVVVYMWSIFPFNEQCVCVEIGNHTITYPTSIESYAYKDSKFYTLKEAYDAKLLTQNDIHDIGTLMSPYYASFECRNTP